MPILHGSYSPSRFPRLNPRANLVNIGNFNGLSRDLANFTDAQKIATFNLLVALGLAARNRSPTHLRDQVDVAHLRNKNDRIVHQGYSELLLEGICSLMEHTEEALVWVHVYRDTGVSYFKECQSKEVIEGAMHYRLPGRLARLQMTQSPFVDAAISYNALISRLLAAFLNEKRRRVRWGEDVDRNAADIPFVVSVNFPSDVLRRPGALAPSEVLGDEFDTSDFTEEDWQLFEDAYNATSKTSNNVTLANAPIKPATTPVATPIGKGKGKAKRTQKEVNSDDDDDLFTASIEAEHERVAQEDRLAQMNADDEEAEAEAIREVLEQSRHTYAAERHLRDIREHTSGANFAAAHSPARLATGSRSSPAPTGSQGYAVQHVDPDTGVTTQGTFVPDLSLSPTLPQQVQEPGTWLFIPGPSQTPIVVQTNGPPSTALVVSSPPRAQSSSTSRSMQGASSRAKEKTALR